MKKTLVFVAAAAALLPTPTLAYASGYLHSYSPNAWDKQVGLCGDAPWFPFAWRPCWWV